MEELTGNRWVLSGIGALVVLAIGGLVWRLRSRKQATNETSFLESRMQPDSFFGASGGQRVDTREAQNAGPASSIGYSLSQLDAIGDVDPVAEADVYLAYGRDLQAEEILKEAMRATPDRLAVRTKLLEVYAKRRDTKGFELLATQLYALTKGVGADWTRAQELGRQIEPDNALYHPGGHPEEIILDGERVVVEPLSATTMPHAVTHGPSTLSPDDLAAQPTQPGGFDLDLDLDAPAPPPPAMAPSRSEPTPPTEATRPLAPSAVRPPDMGLEFDFADSTQPSTRRDAEPPPPATDFGEITLDLSPDEPTATVSRPGPRPLDFDSSTQSPSLDHEVEPTAPGAFDSLLPDETADPLARKLELAEEFRQIGDLEGARDLVSEVIEKSSGALRAKAQSMLDALG